jgi:hypothetical protein
LLAGVGQGRSHQRVADAAPMSGRRHFGVLEVENVIAERGIEELRVAVGQGEEEAGMVGVMPNGHAGPSRRIVSHEYRIPFRTCEATAIALIFARSSRFPAPTKREDGDETCAER